MVQYCLLVLGLAWTYYRTIVNICLHCLLKHLLKLQFTFYIVNAIIASNCAFHAILVPSLMISHDSGDICDDYLWSQAHPWWFPIIAAISLMISCSHGDSGNIVIMLCDRDWLLDMTMQKEDKRWLFFEICQSVIQNLNSLDFIHSSCRIHELLKIVLGYSKLGALRGTPVRPHRSHYCKAGSGCHPTKHSLPSVICELVTSKWCGVCGS